MHAQIATRTIWLRKEAVDLDALWLENQNTFTEYSIWRGETRTSDRRWVQESEFKGPACDSC